MQLFSLKPKVHCVTVLHYIYCVTVMTAEELMVCRSSSHKLFRKVGIFICQYTDFLSQSTDFILQSTDSPSAKYRFHFISQSTIRPFAKHNTAVRDEDEQNSYMYTVQDQPSFSLQDSAHLTDSPLSFIVK